MSRGLRDSLKVVRWLEVDFFCWCLVGEVMGETSMKEDLKGSALSSSSITGNEKLLFYSFPMTAIDLELIPDYWGLRNLFYFKSIGGFYWYATKLPLIFGLDSPSSAAPALISDILFI